MKRLLLVLFSLFLLVAPIAAQSQGETLQVLMDPGKDMIVLNPYTASDSNSIIIMLNLYDGLFSYDSATSEPILALAESYSVSEDGLKWTFKLRNASFSDGVKITSKTFAESWNYMLGGPLASNLDFVNRSADGKLDLETPDSNTAVGQNEENKKTGTIFAAVGGVSAAAIVAGLLYAFFRRRG